MTTGPRNYIFDLYPVIALLDEISRTLSLLRPHRPMIWETEIQQFDYFPYLVSEELVLVV